MIDTLRVITDNPAKILRMADPSCGTSNVQATPSSNAQVASGVGELRVGGVADICIFDPNAVWMVKPEDLKSQGKFTPFAFDMGGTAMPGIVKFTVLGGELVYSRD